MCIYACVQVWQSQEVTQVSPGTFFARPLFWQTSLTHKESNGALDVKHPRDNYSSQRRWCDARLFLLRRQHPAGALYEPVLILHQVSQLLTTDLNLFHWSLGKMKCWISHSMSNFFFSYLSLSLYLSSSLIIPPFSTHTLYHVCEHVLHVPHILIRTLYQVSCQTSI